MNIPKLILFALIREFGAAAEGCLVGICFGLWGADAGRTASKIRRCR